MKIQFFYTSGHTFTASNVIDWGEIDAETFSYSTETYNGDIRSTAQHEVPMFDLLFAVISPSFGELPREGEIHETTIIHGKASKFDISVAAAQMAAIVDEAHVEALEDEKHLQWKAKEHAKYRARQKERYTVYEDSDGCDNDECIRCKI